MQIIRTQFLSILYHIGRNAGCRNAEQIISQNISLINFTDFCQKTLAFSLQCHTIERRTNEKNTEAYLKIMQRDDIEIIGHPDDGRFEVDYEALVDMAKQTGTLLEINNSSLKPGGFRVNSNENARCMLEICRKTGTMVVLGSDAHVDVDIANTKYSSKLLQDVDFPEELVANTSYKKLMSVLKRRR